MIVNLRVQVNQHDGVVSGQNMLGIYTVSANDEASDEFVQLVEMNDNMLHGLKDGKILYFWE